jgi:EmrB/QacA subfamily drug resistance transporter
VSLLTIARELGGVDLMAWVVSGYLVASTVATPLYGKLSDLYGRKRLLTVAILVSLAGSLACALAQTMPQLIAFRALQGLGGGGLLALSQASVADVAPGPERGRYQGYFSGVFAVAAVAGPVLGGYLTHYLSWRAIFWLNLPLAVAALILARRALGKLPHRHARHRIDYPGAILLTAGLSLLLIGLTRIGQGLSWMQMQTLGTFGAAAVLLAACAWQELRAEEPILPPALFANRTVLMCVLALAFQFFVMIGCSVLLPLAMQSLGRATADGVALRMLPLTVAVPLGAFTSGRLLFRGRGARQIMLAGTLITFAAMVGIQLTPITATLPFAVLMGVLGFGLGLPMPAGLVAAQVAVSPSQIGVATATTAFFRSLGGAIGIAVLTSVLLSQLRSDPSAVQSARSALAQLGEHPALLADAFGKVFGLAAAAALLATVAVLALPKTHTGQNA